MSLKPVCPTPIRRGAVVRIPADDGSVLVLSSVDLRFDDGHVERWLGTGSIVEARDPAALVAKGHRVSEEFAMDTDLAMMFRDVPRDALAAAPIEVVFEWNAIPDWRIGPPGLR